MNNPIVFKLLLSAGIVLGVLLFRWLIVGLLLRKVTKAKTHYNWRKGIIYVSNFIILIVLTTIWIEEFQSAATFLGLLAAGLAVALQDPIVNLCGWLYLIFNRPFEAGHRITINENRGDVLEINFFEFTLLELGGYSDSNQSTGRIIHIPNGKVFTEPIINSVQVFEYIWHEMPVLVTFESDWKKAKKILMKIVLTQLKQVGEKAKYEIDEGERKFNIQYSITTPTVYTKVKDSGVELTLRFLVPPKQQRINEQNIWEEMLNEFAKHEDIEFAFPSQTIYVEK